MINGFEEYTSELKTYIESLKQRENAINHIRNKIYTDLAGMQTQLPLTA
jgi:hypothetical protein